jgi:nucleoside-diphosphate-sugar epimerase
LLLIDGLDGEVFNIGNDKEIRIIDLAYKIKDITKSNSEIIFQPLPKDDPLRRCPDLTKARSILGYEPRVSLEEGVKKTIEWYMSNLIKK